MQSMNSEYGSPYLAVCHVTFTFLKHLLILSCEKPLASVSLPTELARLEFGITVGTRV